MIDNLELIKPLLNFEDEGDFYMLYVLKRKKDQPEGNKVEEVIPTKNGYHLITDRFDVLEFKKHFPEIEIQKKNPTILYIPDERNT